MKISAVICEYNPFHNGHKYQLDCIKKESDAVICIMSGDFVQRGDAAVFDKFTRAKSAVISGADLVIMLPVCFSLNTAELFAFGGVSLCSSLNIVDKLYFGSECGDINKLTSAADILLNEPNDVSEKIKNLMNMGVSYPKARTAAFENIIESEILSEPNNILAVEYIKALLASDSTIQPCTIKRSGAGHHDETVSDNIASASAVRNMIRDNKDYTSYIPHTTVNILKKCPHADINKLNSILEYVIRTKTPKEISQINDVSEGMENRIKSAISECRGFYEIAEYVKSKRYTLARIKRILISLILNLDKHTAKAPPEYIRVLAMNQTGAGLLSQIKKKSSLPIITKTADFKDYNKSFEYDVLAGDLYTICTGNPSFGIDYKTSPFVF